MFANQADSRGQNISWKVCDVWWDFPASKKLSHLVAEYVAVVLKEAVFVTTVEKDKTQTVEKKSKEE